MKWNTFIDELFKSKLSNTSVPYNPESWVAMEELLNKEFGQTAARSGLKSTLSKVLFMSSKSLAAATVVSVTMSVLPMNNNFVFKQQPVVENWESTQKELAVLGENQFLQLASVEQNHVEAPNLLEEETSNQELVTSYESPIAQAASIFSEPPVNGSEANFGSTQEKNNNSMLLANETEVVLDEALVMNYMQLKGAEIDFTNQLSETTVETRLPSDLPKSVVKRPLEWNVFAGLNLAKGIGSSLANSIQDNGWIAGVELKMPVNDFVNVVSGLNYSIQKNMDIHYSAQQITYGFGKETQITDYQYDEIHFASIPLLLEAKLKKHSLALGAFYSRLVTTKASINHSVENSLTEKSTQNLDSEYGFTQGFAKNDLGIAASYNYAVTANLSVGSYVNFGTNDITNNEHFGEHKLDRMLSANLVLRYGFNW